MAIGFLSHFLNSTMNEKAELSSGHGIVRKYYCWQVAPLQSLFLLISAFAIYFFFKLIPPTIFGIITFFIKDFFR